MKILKRISIAAAMIFLVIPLCGQDGFKSNDQDDDLQTQFEEVTVENTQFPVRVFQKDIPVKNLKKKDFRLFINGKKRAINAFYEVRKKLGNPGNSNALKGNAKHKNQGFEPRLFVFVFNVSDYHMNLEKDVDTVFRDILRLNDRYMVLTNSYFMMERQLKNREIEKKQVLLALQKEANRLKMHFLQTEVELRTLAAQFLFTLEELSQESTINARFGRNLGDPMDYFKEFFRDYLVILEQARQGYFGMTKKQYVKIAQYLKSQDAEKWVLSFYQVGIFPKFKTMGRIQGAIDSYAQNTGDNLEMKKLLMDFLPRLNNVDQWTVHNIGKLFVNSGATVHTLIIKPVNKNPMEHFDYQPIPTDSESILREIARKTGGSIMRSMDTDDFLKRISQKEDVYYMLSYAPEPGEKKNASIKIVVNKKERYRLSYDNQRRPTLFKKILKRIKEENPQIRIETILVNKDTLSVVVSNIKTINPVTKDDARIGKIHAKIVLMNDQSKVVWETAKGFRCKKSKSMFKVQLPTLITGNYDILVEVKDILSWKTDTAGENIKVGES